MTDDLTAKLEELTKLIESTSANLAPIVEAVEATQQEEKNAYAKYQQEIQHIRAKRIELDEQRFKIQSVLNNATSEVASIKMQMEAERRAKEEAERQAKLEAERAERLAKQAEQDELLREKFDKLTVGAPWREWAKEHQLEAGRIITQNRNVILADPMGLGKTLSSIIVAEMAQRATIGASPEFPFLGEEASYWNSETQQYETRIINGIERPVGKRILYLCPASLVKNVRDEWKRWTPHRNVMFIYKMTKAEREFALEMAYDNFTEYVVICNYEAWRRDRKLLEWFKQMDFDTLIVDEAHNAKEQSTSVWQGINYLLNSGRRPEYFIPMTGTPILNRPQELFTLLNLVAPTEFYHENDFLYTYCEQYENDQGTVLWRFQPGGLDRLSKRISKYFLRRTKDQAGIKLPPKTIIHHDLELDTETYAQQARARDEMRKYATVVVNKTEGKAITAAAVIAMYTRLRQIETWPAGIVQYEKDDMGNFVYNKDGSKSILLQLDVEESQKVDYCIAKDSNGEWNGLIPEAISDERMVLFSQFKAPLREIQRRCEQAGIRAVVLDGDTPDKIREEIRVDFDVTKTPDRTQSKWDIVLCNYKVGGVGLNLTAATQLIVLDEEWNPGKRDQAYDRIHRIGQEKPVTIHVLRMQETIDDWLASIIDSKDETVTDFNNITSAAAFKDALDSGLI